MLPPSCLQDGFRSQLGRTWAQLGRSWAQLGPILASSWKQKWQFRVGEVAFLDFSAICVLRRRRWPQDEPWRRPRAPKRAPRGPKRAPRGPKRSPGRSQGRPKTAPRRLQVASKSLPSRLQKSSYIIEIHKSRPRDPKRPQETPKSRQEASKSRQDAPKRPPRGSKEAPKRLQVFSKRPHLHDRHGDFLWEGFDFCIIPTCVQYVTVREPPGPRSAGFNPAAYARSVRPR